MARGAGTCIRRPQTGCSKATARCQRAARSEVRPEAPRGPRAQVRARKQTNYCPWSPRKKATTKDQAGQGCGVKAKAMRLPETFKPKRNSGKCEGNLGREELSSYLISLGWDAIHSQWPLTGSVAS